MPQNKFPTTGIGSLPHHNIDSALEFSFRFDIPFLPQIPIRNPWEFMLAQALEGLPGLQAEKDGLIRLDTNVWLGRCHAFNERLLEAFSNAAKFDAFQSFEPGSATASCYQPFLWELEERKVPVAKVQIAGPLTSQWVMRLSDGRTIDAYPELPNQVFRLILARSLGMCRRLRASGVEPILFLDEPALFGFSPTNAKHLLGLSELKLLITALKKESVRVGLHCCSNTHWPSVLGLGLDILSLDAKLSLLSLTEAKKDLSLFIEGGGVLSLGVVPTTDPKVTKFNARETATFVSETLGDLREGVLQRCILSPACGLALNSPSDAEMIVAELNDVRDELFKNV